MSKNILVVPDPHAHPDHNNDRADYLGKLILDIKPDVVVNMGDTYDMPSLSSFDKGKASFNGRSYEKDIVAGNDFLDRMWYPIKKAKKKRPRSIFLEGNHERRLNTVLEQQPELGGSTYGIGYKNYLLDDYHHEVYHYNGMTPAVFSYEDIHFAHFMISGLMGRPIGGEHHASSLITKTHSSCVVAHSHTYDYSVKNTSTGRKIMGLVAGVYQDYDSGWAGNANRMWHAGVSLLNNASGGSYDLQFISLDSLRKEYS